MEKNLYRQRNVCEYLPAAAYWQSNYMIWLASQPPLAPVGNVDFIKSLAEQSISTNAAI